jgi:hypothetical protein
MYKEFLPIKAMLPLVLLLMFIAGISAQVPAPKEHFGFTPGDDRMMFLYEDLMRYMEKLAEVSPEVHIEEVGKTEMGRPMYMVFVSSEENIRNLHTLRDINR